MKKKFYLLAMTMFVAGCNNVPQNMNPTIIVPNGAPLIGISNYGVSHKDDIEVVAGPDLLKAAFAGEDKDIIIAPINLGALRYNAKETYGLYRPIVWDNIFILSRNEIKSVQDLNNQKITAFGKGSSPDIVLNTILSHSGVTAEIEYLSNAQLANTTFKDGQSDIVITAEPFLSTVNMEGAYKTSLTTFWKEATGFDSYPQSGIFVKISAYESLKNVLKQIDSAYDKNSSDVAGTAKNAAKLSNGAFPEALLNKAIPNCGFKSFKNEKEMVEGYYQAIIDLGQGASLGGKLPNEGFYLQK